MLRLKMIYLFVFVVFAITGFLGSAFLNNIPIARWNAFSKFNLQSTIRVKQQISNPILSDIVSEDPDIFDDIDVTKGMPDKKKFREFFFSCVEPNQEMTLDQFLKYPEVSNLLNTGFIFYNDVYSLWISAVGDASGLDKDEAYEMLCMVLDLPDPEDIEFLDTEYKKISDPVTGLLSLAQLMMWSDIQDMLKEEALTEDEITDIWKSIAGDLTATIDRSKFAILNNALDNKINENEEAEDESSRMRKEHIQYLTNEYNRLLKINKSKKLEFQQFLNWDDIDELMKENGISRPQVVKIWNQVVGNVRETADLEQFIAVDDLIEEELVMSDPQDDDVEDDQIIIQPTLSVTKNEEEKVPVNNVQEKQSTKATKDDEVEVEDLVDLTGVNVWAPSFDPATVFDEDVYNDISKFYRENAISGGISFTVLRQWQDIEDLITEGSLSEQDFKSIWAEAPKNFKGLLDFDTFIRFNVRLDVIVQENEQRMINSKNNIKTPSTSSAGSPSTSASTATTTAKPTVTSSTSLPADEIYRKEFRDLTKGGRLLRLDMILEGTDVKELILEGSVTEKQVESMFNMLPQEPMGIPSTVFGINEDSYVKFNKILDAYLQAEEGGLEEEVEPVLTSTPAALLSTEKMPLPAEPELKIGSLGSKSEKEDTSVGMSETELEMLQVLDKADNMLNSGSFGDFDVLINDVNDPRLAALREKNKEGQDEVRGQLKDIVAELLVLGREQTRCGLDLPDEEEAARLRDLMTAAIEKSPRMADRPLEDIRNDLSGNWKLLYTNSEMFRFYNGITGLVNVFPTSKFDSLSVSFSSDGYLNEAKYLEYLKTSLGGIDAVVYANWEIVKEMSFMTNENSVVLRNYCTKVTAGPFKYEAEENWKSLRAMSMNELVYMDDKIRIMRNCGALRIFFLYERVPN